MYLKFKAQVPDEESFVISVNGENQTVSRKNKIAQFDLSESKNYHITISQQLHKSNRKLINWLIYFLTFLIQGVFYIAVSAIFVLDYNDYGKWYESVKFYCINSGFDLYVSGDTDIKFRVVSGGFKKSSETFTKPQIEVKCCEEKLEVGTEYVVNTENVKNNLCSCIRMITAMLMTIFIVAVIFAVVTFSNLTVFGICIGVAVLCLSLNIGLVIYNYKKYKNIIGDL